MAKVYDSALSSRIQQEDRDETMPGNAKFQSVVWTAGMKRLGTLVDR